MKWKDAKGTRQSLFYTCLAVNDVNPWSCEYTFCKDVFGSVTVPYKTMHVDMKIFLGGIYKQHKHKEAVQTYAPDCHQCN